MSNQRALAIIDLLGIKNLTHEKTLHELSVIYDSFIGRADVFLAPLNTEEKDIFLFQGHPKNIPLCERYILSDSIVLVANSSSIEDSMKLIVSSWRLLQSCFFVKQPVRGAIVYDEVLSRPDQNYVIGKALVRANELEKRQNWMGVIVDGKFAKELKIEIPNIFGTLLFKYDVPCKIILDDIKEKDLIKEEFWCLNWRYNFVVKLGTRSLFEGNPCIDKVENTLAFAKEVVRAGAIYTTDQGKCPAELRCMWVGDTEPPFLHGDEL